MRVSGTKLGAFLIIFLSCTISNTVLSGNGTTEIVSVDSAGIQGNGFSGRPSISQDGRYVAFPSFASNLVPGDTNGEQDIFVHDRDTGLTERVSVNSDGIQGNSDAETTSISPDGRYVAFSSWANNLVPADTNGAIDVFVHDRNTGLTERVSVDRAGAQGNDHSQAPSISQDGRYVAFHSRATNLVTGDTNNTQDVFIHDRDTGLTERVSVDSAGIQGNLISGGPSISQDGRYVAFYSIANNLVPGDTNQRNDVFVHDRGTGLTERVSVDSAGIQGNFISGGPSISQDGRYVAFSSDANNLVPGDTNNALDVFVHDRQTGLTERVSVDSAGIQGNSSSFDSSICQEGRYVAFSSLARNLVPGDTNLWDVFVHDRVTGLTEQISVDSVGTEGNSESLMPSISQDCRYVTFYSYATNLVPDDTNGATDVFVRTRIDGGETLFKSSFEGVAVLGGVSPEADE